MDSRTQEVASPPRGATASLVTAGVASDIKSRFWTTYTRESADYDAEFLERYQSDMDIVLIFAGLFSAVSATFLTGQATNLSQDETLVTNQLLVMLVDAIHNTTLPAQNITISSFPWNGPQSTVVWS
ncbi:hypothetical protein PAXINDRAFT_166904 [Paxillus involutus ATCC 200175]|nr:hypothetical protein PAXINDRAFT_166904 [Paxillus involutus ATCC 200175]